MISKEVKYIVISDVHLGHRHNSTEEIIENLVLFFDNFSPRNDSLDIIFIAGDLFDTLLDLSTDQVSSILIWISKLMLYCMYNKIKLRILEGTPSHDWMQSSMFNTIDKIANLDQLDYKYIKSLAIEVIPDYNLSILYVPDEWNDDASRTYKEVISLLAANSLSKIDIAIMHGQFIYQLPQISNLKNKHIETDYLDIVNHFINIGHVHQFSKYDRILSQGSFDRLCHGDEDHKGALYMTIRPNMNDSFIFIENKTAKIFKTINIPDKAFTSLFDYLDSKLTKVRKGSYIRLRTKNKQELVSVYESIVNRYLDYHISKDISNSKDIDIGKIIDSNINIEAYIPVIINKENISSLLIENIVGKYSESTYNLNILNFELQKTL